MGYVLLFAFMVCLVYAVVGASIFEDYTQVQSYSLYYQDYFNTVGANLITLFQLLTLDQWDVINRSLLLVVDPVATNIYVITWVFLGGISFVT